MDISTLSQLIAASRKKDDAIKIRAQGKDIELLLYQNDHVRILTNTLSVPRNKIQFKLVMDTSPTGHGKTITTLKIIKNLQDRYSIQYKAFIICPKSLVSMWEYNCEEYGIPIEYIGTVAGFVGDRNRINNPYLMNGIINSEEDADKIDIRLTPYFQNLIVNDNMFFIYDEFDFAKNPNRAQAALVQIAKLMMASPNSMSRGLYLSATPNDKVKLNIGIYKLLGLIHHPSYYIYNIQTGYELTGIIDMYNISYKMNPTIARAIWPTNGAIDKNNAGKIADKLFAEIFRSFLISNMPLQIFMPQHKYDGYFYVPKELKNDLNTAIASLRRAVRDMEAGVATRGKQSFGQITNALVKINRAKRPIMLYQALRILNKPDTKVILYVNYIEDLNWLVEQFNKLGHQVSSMYGKTSTKNRDLMISKFRKPTKDVRVFISHFKVGGRGIQLDSIWNLEDGGYIPYTLVMPNYFFLDLAQLAGRTQRAKTQTESYIIFVFGDTRQVLEEASILRVLAEKNSVVKTYIQTGEIAKLPGEYDKFIEYNEIPTEDPPMWNDLLGYNYTAIFNKPISKEDANSIDLVDYVSGAIESIVRTPTSESSSRINSP